MPDVTIAGATYPDVPAVDLPRANGGGNVRYYDPDEILYAGSPTSGGPANVSNGLPTGKVDSTSTATAFTATISTLSGITEYYDGLTIILKNGVVTSASGFTLNINGLGAKPAYSNMATGNDITPTAPTRETTIFNINYTMIFVYSVDIVEGGGWVCYRGYDANTNTIGYQIRTNSMSLPLSGALYRYRLLVTSKDGKNFIPVNSTNSTSADTQKTTTTSAFDPFGSIRYYGSTTNVSSGSRPSAAVLWQQYTFNIGYSFNTTGSAPALTSWRPVYLRCSPQADGSVKFASTPMVQALPTSADTHVYILLGIAYSAANVELFIDHPVYYHDGTGLQRWNGVKVPRKVSDLTNDSGFITAEDVPSPSDSAPQSPGTASAGVSDAYSRADHVHPAQNVTASDVGLGNLDNVRQYSASNPPPYPVTSVNGSTGAVTVRELPAVSTADNDKVLRVVNGEWAAVSLPSASGVSF